MISIEQIGSIRVAQSNANQLSISLRKLAERTDDPNARARLRTLAIKADDLATDLAALAH